jgi:DNA-binding NarL/FixJ family response regulator
LKHVLIAVQANILATGIESVLKTGEGLAVDRIAFNDKNIVRAEIDRLQPAILVLEEMQGLTQVLPLLELFRLHPNLKILVVNADSNIVQVYERRELCLEASIDLVQAVQSFDWGNGTRSMVAAP